MTSKFPIIVSTDIVGLFGNPNQVLTFWDKAGLNPDDLGIEVIAWTHSLPFLSSNTRQHIAGFHSRTMNISNTIKIPKLVIANLLISPPAQILNQIKKYNLQNPHYILNHNTHKSKMPVSTFVNYVWENDNKPGALEATNALSTSKNMVIDLFHLSLSEKLSWSNPVESQKLLNIIEKYASNCFAFHIPIGQVANDSLPLDISDESIAQLNILMKKFDITPIIECQWGGFDSIYCEPAKSPEKISYVKSCLSRLNFI